MGDEESEPLDPVDKAVEVSEEAWHDAMRAHQIWDCAVQVWAENENDVTEAAREAAYQNWQMAKAAAMEAEIELEDMLHSEDCPACGEPKQEAKAEEAN